MSVLIVYATSNYATIMSDSRETVYKDQNCTELVDYIENSKKIYKMSDSFIIGSAGNSSLSKNLIQGINPQDPSNSFYTLKNYSYTEFLKFFTIRFNLSHKRSGYQSCVIVMIGIDNNKIRLDLMNSNDYIPHTTYPNDEQLACKIYLPKDIPDLFEKQFADGLEIANNKELYCENVIKTISTKSNLVNDRIQKFTVRI